MVCSAGTDDDNCLVLNCCCKFPTDCGDKAGEEGKEEVKAGGDVGETDSNGDINFGVTV